MIKHHPKSELLNAFVLGELPASVSAAVAIHVEMCPCCQDKVAQLTEAQASQFFSSELPQEDDQLIGMMDTIIDDDLSDMLGDITSDESLSPVPEIQVAETQEIKGMAYQLPTALRNVDMNSWFNIGKLSRAKLEIEDGPIHTHLLHIDKEGEVPTHTHKGFELTLLLEGSFEDEMGTYHKGDFIWLDGEHTHQPITKEGCLCLTVVNDALHFTQGFSKLLNPIGNLIY